MSDGESLRDLAETLDGCEWNHPLGSADLCRRAANEIEGLNRRVFDLMGKVSRLRGENGELRRSCKYWRDAWYTTNGEKPQEEARDE